VSRFSRKKRILIVILIVALALILFFYIRDFMIIDKCLDSGGRWNYEEGKCEH